jgi:hypothetical protein
MCIDAVKAEKLIEQEFDELYNKDVADWHRLAKNACESIRQIRPGEIIYVGDVIALLEPTVKLSAKFKKFTKKGGLQDNHWPLWYAEYIVYRVFPQTGL